MTTIVHIAVVCLLSQEPDAGHKSLAEQARKEYWAGHFLESEKLFVSALSRLPDMDETARAALLTELGDVYVNEDKLDMAERVYKDSLRIYKAAADHSKVVLLLRNLGSLYSLRRRDDLALKALREALKVAERELKDDWIIKSRVLNGLGIVYYRQRKIDKAEKTFTEASQLPSVDVTGRIDLLNNLGAIYHAKGLFEKSIEYLTQALKLNESQVGLAHPDLTFSLSALAVVYTDMGRYAEAEAEFQRALAILDPGSPVFDSRIARLLHSLSRTYALAGRNEEAETTLSKAGEIARKRVKEHPDMALIMDAYAAKLNKDGNIKEAEEVRVEAKRARVAAGLVISAHALQF